VLGRNALALQFKTQSPARKPTMCMPGIDPRLGERSVVDQTRTHKAIEHLVGNVVGHELAPKHIGQFATAPI
jgi:hypothetical protein